MKNASDFFDLAGSVPGPEGVESAPRRSLRDAAWAASVRDPR